MKVCTMCKLAKPDTEFHRNKKNRSGLAERCKLCNAIAYKVSRDKNIESRRVSENERHRKRRRSAAFQERERARAAKNLERKRKKKYAHNVISRAMTAGRLSRGLCEVCDSAQAVAHHDDYNKPQEVRWLCVVHHSEWHTKNGPGLNALPDHAPQGAPQRTVYECPDGTCRVCVRCVETARLDNAPSAQSSATTSATPAEGEIATG